MSDIETTQELPTVSEPQPVRKVTFTFDESVARNLQTFAFIHNLGTREVLVSLRTPDGDTKALKTYLQDENVALITFAREQYNTFNEGDTLIAIG